MQALDLVPTKIHQRSPIILGSYEDVEEIKALDTAERPKHDQRDPYASYSANLLLYKSQLPLNIMREKRGQWDRYLGSSVHTES